MKKKFVLSVALMALIIYEEKKVKDQPSEWTKIGFVPFQDKAITTSSDRSGTRLSVQGTTLLITGNDIYQPDEYDDENIDESPTAKEILADMYAAIDGGTRSIGERVSPTAKKEEEPTAKKEEKPAAKKEEKPTAKKEEKPAAKKEEKPAAKKEEKPAAKKEENHEKGEEEEIEVNA